MGNNTDRLNCDAVDCKPLNIDWREALGEDMEGWRAFEAFDCDECGQEVVLSSMGEDEHRHLEHEVTVPDLADGDTYKCHDCGHEFTVVINENGDAGCPECSECIIPGDTFENNCTGYLCFEGPMMNYWYPVRIDDAEEAAKAIASYPLCVVEFSDGRTGLALTGGGMDLSIEICLAFIALGYLPPIHFCSHLPRMAGVKLDDKMRRLIVASRQSCEFVLGQAQSGIDDLNRLEKELASDS